MKILLSIPASFFGMVLGLVGLGDCWRVASKLWALPWWIAELIMICAFILWMILLALYILKWVWFRKDAIAEVRHPVQSCFVGLAGVATLLAAVAIGPHIRTLGLVLYELGAVTQLLYGIYFVGITWQGGRHISTATPALYLPTVAGNFVSSFVSGYFGYPEIGIAFLGIGFFSWIAIESIISHRLMHDEVIEALRPTIGIMLAPPVVGCIGYLFVTGGVTGEKPGLIALCLFGYGLFQFLLQFRLMRWISQQSFNASYWAFSFGITAIAFDAIIFVSRGLNGGMELLAKTLFAWANLIILALVVGTLWRLCEGKLLPQLPKVIGEKTTVR